MTLARWLTLTLLILGFSALARADDTPAADRVRGALATARHDLEEERARTEMARAEAARVISATQSKRDAAAARLDAARQARRDLSARETAVRTEIEKATGEIEALENDLGPARDLCRRLTAELAARPSIGSAAERADRAKRIAAVVHAADDPGSDLGALAGECLALESDDVRRASQGCVSEGEVEIEGQGRVHGRVLTLGPGAWFLGADGTEAMQRRIPGRADGAFVGCAGEGIGRAFAALDRGERRLELPIDATGEALGGGSGSVLRRGVELLRQGGLAILPLALLSVVTIVVLVERLLARRRITADAKALVAAVKAAVAAGDLDAARAHALRGGALGRALLRGLGPVLETDGVERASQAFRAALTAQLRHRLWLLGTVGASAPFVGLFGTVVGIVRAFEDIARSGAAGFNVVAGGIAEALVATAAGIVVAIVAVVAYNWLQAWTTTTTSALGVAAEDALTRREPGANHGA
jgi:biopolymer transport protein ExbB